MVFYIFFFWFCLTICYNTFCLLFDSFSPVIIITHMLTNMKYLLGNNINELEVRYRERERENQNQKNDEWKQNKKKWYGIEMKDGKKLQPFRYFR